MGKVARADEVVGYNLRQGVSKKNFGSDCFTIYKRFMPN